jgi:hypothetical protein
MRYLENSSENPLVGEFEIIVNTIFNNESFRFSCMNTDTILNLKKCIMNTTNSHPHPLEQELMIGVEFPYSLKDELKLSDLLENHRKLTLLISEKPDKVVPKKFIKFIRRSYLEDKEIPGGTKVLNLQNITEDYIEYIGDWLFPDIYRTIEIDWNNTNFYEIIKEIVDTLDISLYDKPLYIKNIVFYNKDIMTEKHLQSFIYFSSKLKDFKCFKNINFIDYTTKTTFFYFNS